MIIPKAHVVFMHFVVHFKAGQKTDLSSFSLTLHFRLTGDDRIRCPKPDDGDGYRQ